MTFSLSDNFETLDAYLQAKAPHEPEFQQAVTDVMADVKPIIDNNSAYKQANIFERIVSPERVISFQVPWQTDDGDVSVNTGYRIQFNGAIGPFKGGLRFHPSVNASVLKFLGFEQTFKNALTGLPMGGGKGGSDFNPRGRSDAEVMRFCNAFMQELYRHIGPDTDVPAGDINVGAREIGYLFGAYRRIANQFQGVLTGKGLAYGGSSMRTEATGYGVILFLTHALSRRKDGIEGKVLVISGAGNVATYAAEKAIGSGARVVTLSDSSGFIYDKDGLDQHKVNWIRQHKAKAGSSLEDYTHEFGGDWHAGQTPWGIECDVALPCATQNELDGEAAKTLIKNGTKAVIEGANMPCTADAKAAFDEASIIFVPGKAANAGGVAVSGLEISQNRHRRYMEKEAVERELENIMAHIHEQCVEEGTRDGNVNYVKGANIAGFRKVADAMLAQGIG